MSAENKALVRRGVDDIWNGRNVATINDILASDFIVHAPAPDEEIHGPDGVRSQFRMLRTAFPDLVFTVEEQVAEGNLVATRWSATGTHRGEFKGIPPTGRQARVTGIDIDRVAGGKIVECWSEWDELTLLQLLGAIREPEPAGPAH